MGKKLRLLSHNRLKAYKCIICGLRANSRGYCPKHRPEPTKGPRSPKKEKKPLKRTALKRVRKVTGELAMFQEIWAERPHVCQITGTPIREFNVSCFAHLLFKKGYGKYRLNKENVWLVQDWVHGIIDQGDTSKLEQYPKWAEYCEERDRLREQYNRENKVKRIE